VVEVKRRKKEERKKSDILIMYILIYITDAINFDKKIEI
jgi:hypothetical protein